MFIKAESEIMPQIINAGIKTFKKSLISSEDAPNFAMRKFIIEPGGSMPIHTNTVEHEQFILNGKAELQIGENKFVVKKDDVVFIPKGIKHNYKTIGEEAFEFLCIIPNKKDLIELIAEEK